MNLEKAKVLLEKVNALMKSMEMAPDQVATIEKDLMKNYLRELYESFHDFDTPGPKPDPVVKKIERLDPSPKASPKPDPKPEPKEEPKVELEIKETPAPPQPVTPELPKSEETPAPPAREEKEEEQPIIKEESKEKPADKKPSFTYVDPELEEIFLIQTAKELSEKLSQLPIPDLTKAFGLNEKIFTINELFGGDAELFTTVIKSLNKMDNFEEAKNYLIDKVAQNEEWSAAPKRKKAIEFIKIVKRRYN